MTDKDNSIELSEKSLPPRNRISETTICPKCNSPRGMHDPEYAETVCLDCGFITKQNTTTQETKKTHTKRIKTNIPLTYTIHDKGSITVVDWHNRNNYNKNTLANQKTQMYQLRNWHRRIRVTDSTEHNLAFALSEIVESSNKLNLPKNILENATTIYQKTTKKHLTNRHSIQSIVAATLYLACKQCEPPKTLDEIAQATAVDKKEIGKNYIRLIKKLNYPTASIQPNQIQNNT
ncbi:MAG: hypothetical protein LBE76_01675 [Nitrososphaerota archaeon]|jgi:transcription initiation factor TFIIB|nr:hypothetical protein [Nitrososphaerota archaeon]